MRFLEFLKTIRNKFIRKNPQTQPEGNQKALWHNKSISQGGDADGNYLHSRLQKCSRKQM